MRTASASAIPLPSRRAGPTRVPRSTRGGTGWAPSRLVGQRVIGCFDGFFFGTARQRRATMLFFFAPLKKNEKDWPRMLQVRDRISSFSRRRSDWKGVVSLSAGGKRRRRKVHGVESRLRGPRTKKGNLNQKKKARAERKKKK